MKKIGTLKTPTINQNGYHKNILTKERIGTLFIYPTDYTPDDCLSCDGYALLIIDYEDLFNVIGTQFNQLNDPNDTFRVPDYNITGKFLQPGINVGSKLEAGIPNITGTFGTPLTRGHYVSGAFDQNELTGYSNLSYGSWAYTFGFDFDASRSSSVYGNSETVQPSSQIVHICIKYK